MRPSSLEQQGVHNCTERAKEFGSSRMLEFLDHNRAPPVPITTTKGPPPGTRNSVEKQCFLGRKCSEPNAQSWGDLFADSREGGAHRSVCFSRLSRFALSAT